MESFVYYEKIVDLRKNRKLEHLTAQEEEIMLVIWKQGKVFVKEIIAYLHTDIPYTTIASTVKNLEKKGYVRSEKMGNAFRYFAVILQNDYKKTFMKEVVQDYFQNDYKQLVNFFVQEQHLSATELQEIIQMIEQNKGPI